MSLRTRFLGLASLCVLLATAGGCVHFGSCGGCGPQLSRRGCDPCGNADCQPCGYDSCGCDPCGRRLRCRSGCGCGLCGNLGNHLTNADLRLCSHFYRRSNAIPDTLPLGSTNRSWYQAMETNAEAVDFIVYEHDFIGDTARLTSDGRDHLWEIAARMRSVPFPVIVERSENNSNPELDALRRQLVVSVLANFGNNDAEQRTVVSMPYGPGYTAVQAEPMYYQHVGAGGVGNNGSFGNNLGTFGGGGGGGGGGIGFGN